MDYQLPSLEENVAMIRICLDLATCDGNLNAGKIEALNRVVSFLQCGQVEADKAQAMNPAQAMLIAQKMSEENRDMLIMLLNNVAKGDGPINNREEYCINATKMMLNL
jgi:uncharacterized tellurite resistance protein B-like protein